MQAFCLERDFENARLVTEKKLLFFLEQKVLPRVRFPGGGGLNDVAPSTTPLSGGGLVVPSSLPTILPPDPLISCKGKEKMPRPVAKEILTIKPETVESYISPLIELWKEQVSYYTFLSESLCNSTRFPVASINLYISLLFGYTLDLPLTVLKIRSPVASQTRRILVVIVSRVSLRG